MILLGDALTELKRLNEQSVQCCVSSPPYWGLRDYGVDGQLGLEKNPDEYVRKLVAVFREVRRVLRDDGTLWLNLGDSYSGSGARSSNPGGKINSPKQLSNHGSYVGDHTADIIPHGLKPKDLVGIPWRVAFALQADGWYLRQDIIWAKPNPMPESVTDRCTKSHEYIFLLSKSKKYYFDHRAIQEPAVSKGIPNSPQSIKSPYGQGFTRRASKTPSRELSSAFLGHSPTNYARCGDNQNGYRNRRSVWTVTTKPFKGAHFATFPPDLIEPCILAGSPKGGVILDPFFGAGTVGLVAKKHQRDFIGIELNPSYVEMANSRLEKIS